MALPSFRLFTTSSVLFIRVRASEEKLSVYYSYLYGGSTSKVGWHSRLLSLGRTSKGCCCAGVVTPPRDWDISPAWIDCWTLKMEMILIRFFLHFFHFFFHYFVFDLSNERRVVVFSPPFLRIRKFFVVGKKSKEGGIFTLISESGFEFFSCKSRSHFLQLVIGMTDRQTLSATFRNSDSRERGTVVTFQSWVVKLKTRCVLN